jgi:hypothetical protein
MASPMGGPLLTSRGRIALMPNPDSTERYPTPKPAEPAGAKYRVLKAARRQGQLLAFSVAAKGALATKRQRE